MSIVKKYYKDFIFRALVAMGFGGITLSIIYLILGVSGIVDSIPVFDVVLGYLTISFLAFICGGMTVVFKIEELPISKAITLHGIVLYFSYLVVYIVNDWLKGSIISVIVFSVIFVVVYAIIWIVIYFTTKNGAEKLNKQMNNRIS